MVKDFFLTWSKQNGPMLDVESSDADEFVLADGQRIYDFVSTSFQSNFGHSFEPICSAIKQQLDRMPIASPKAAFELKNRASERLRDLIGLQGRAFYTVSGAESVENALKIARQITGKSIILARQQSYHGATLGALSVTGDWRCDGHLTFNDGTVRIPEPGDDPHAVATQKIISDTGADNIAAVIVETISGTNGVCIPPASWFEAIAELCVKHRILLILDEVLCGFRRTGTNFAFQQYGLEPDLICMSKAITGGYIPFGATWVSERIARHYDDNVLSCGLTNYAHPLGLAALNAVVESLTSNSFCNRVRGLESEFSIQLDRLKSLPRVKSIRSRGLLAALDLTDVAPTWQQFVDAGLYVFSKGNMVILAPPLISSPERLQHAFKNLTRALGEFSE